MSFSTSFRPNGNNTQKWPIKIQDQLKYWQKTHRFKGKEPMKETTKARKEERSLSSRALPQILAANGAEGVWNLEKWPTPERYMPTRSTCFKTRNTESETHIKAHEWAITHTTQGQTKYLVSTKNSKCWPPTPYQTLALRTEAVPLPTSVSSILPILRLSKSMNPLFLKWSLPNGLCLIICRSKQKGKMRKFQSQLIQ